MSGIDFNFIKNQNLSDINLEYPDTKKEITKKWLKTPSQQYTGEVFHGHIHGRGFYFIEAEEKIFYDGLFYANKLEGYAQVFYNDGSHFQGLFKGNIRFGPGVLTHPNGQQDVGLWMGRSLVRLGSVNDRNIVPRLATTPLGQLKLLKYRYLVPVYPKRVDVAHDTLMRLGANDTLLQSSYKLYNTEIGIKNNIFFNKNLFDQQFYTDHDCSIDIVMSEEENSFEDDNKSQPREETPTNLLDINVERVRQLSQQIEIIESRLQTVKEKKAAIEGKVDYCKSCCHNAAEVSIKSSQSSSSSSTRTQVDNSEEEMFAKSQPAVRIDDEVKIDTYSDYSYTVTEDSATVFSNDDQQISVSNFEEDLFLHSDTSNVTTQIKDYLMDTCICDEALDTPDLHQMEKELETLNKDVVFFECILKNLREKLEMHMKKSKDGNTVKTKKISVKDVLAWNNEEICMHMLKHGFLHRNSEYMVNFDVSNLIAGNREQFGVHGGQEKHCLEFLNACNEGNTETILKLVNKNQVNIDVCDAKGNSGLFLAAVNREIDTIKLLVNLGAKINPMNDEGLLPLSMCLLIYLAEKYVIQDWEKSFLSNVIEPMIEQKDAYKWYQTMSLNVLARHGRTTYSFIEEVRCRESETNMFKVDVEKYFFEISCPDPEEKEVIKSVAYNPRISVYSDHEKPIEESIKTLLNCGANPNAGEAPLPPLFLSLFTENLNLVNSVLSADADINTTIEEEMTALHVVASLKCSQTNADICSLLLEYNCDPTLKTTPNHWPEQKKIILGNYEHPDEIEDVGKNPLHIICLRRDFTMDKCSYFQQMAMVLSDSRIDCNEKYLGHTPLSLAILVGNKCLVETLVELNVTDPHQTLDYNMGNVLTIYILRRYNNQIPPNAKEILAYLVKSDVNPLKHVGEFENTVAFMNHEHGVQRTKSKGGKLHKLEHELRKASTSKEDTREVSQTELRQYIVKCARNTIVKYIQLFAVQTLYNFIEEGLTDHRCVVILSEFLSPDIIILNLQYLFKYGKINSSRFDKDLCLKLINIVNDNQVKLAEEAGNSSKKKKAMKKERIKEVTSDLQTNVPSPSVHINTSDYGHILDMTDFKKIDQKKYKEYKLLYPGLDNTAKYKVCFHCLTKQNRILMLCPRCQLIYFCSEECNMASLKLNTVHVCHLNFYASEKIRLKSLNTQEEERRETHEELYARLEESCENRRKQKLEDDVELARLQYLEERKSDTYGTKWVKWRREQRMEIKRTDTNLTLLGSVGDLAKLDSETGSLYKREAHDSIARRTFSGSNKIQVILPKGCIQHTVRRKPTVKEKAAPKKHPRRCDRLYCSEKSDAVCGCKRDSIDVFKKIKSKTKEEIEAPVEKNVVVRKLRNIPSKYEAFIGLLTKYFPDVDFSHLFLPYTCYSNGHLYYNFSNNELSKNNSNTYSMM